MIIETLLIAIFAISLGVIVDYFIGINMIFEMPSKIFHVKCFAKVVILVII